MFAFHYLCGLPGSDLFSIWINNTMANVPTVEVGTGNQQKVVEPILLVAIGPSGNIVPVAVTSDGKLKIA